MVRMEGFRPLTGICFSKLEVVTMEELSYSLGFRPLTGICFSKFILDIVRDTLDSFRPLTGICFSKSG